VRQHFREAPFELVRKFHRSLPCVIPNRFQR